MAHIHLKDERSVKLKSTLGDLVRQSRRNKGLSQREASKMLGVDRGNFQKIEAGKRNISIDTFVKLVDTLNISHRHILELFEERKVIDL